MATKPAANQVAPAQNRTVSDAHKAALEKAFVNALSGYSQRKRITYVAWREVGVPARVLRAAGIRRAAP